MNWIDILILILLALAAFVGWKLGIIRVVVTLVGIALGIYLAGQGYETVAKVTDLFVTSDNGAKVLAFIIIFGGVMVGAVVVSRMVKGLLRRLMLGWVDQAAGMALWVAIVGAILATFLTLVASFPVLGLESTIRSSSLGSFLLDNYNLFLGLLPGEFEGG
ncbi:MAG: CvpA family protein [Dehalococcoidia bacterium]